MFTSLTRQAAMDELRGFGVDFVDTVLSEDTWSSWGNAGKTILNMLRTEFIKLALLNPLKNLINGNSDLPTLSSALGKLGALFGGSAPTEDALIVARILQGFSAGVAQPLVMATIFTVFPPERRGSAMGVFGLGVVFAPAIGPTLGGLMIEYFSWRYVFFISLPFCVIAAVLGLFFMPTRRIPREIPPFDWLGFALLGMALLGLMTGIAASGASGQSVLLSGIAALVAARTPAREERFAWLFPVGQVRFAVFTRKGGLRPSSDVTALQGRRVFASLTVRENVALVTDIATHPMPIDEAIDPDLTFKLNHLIAGVFNSTNSVASSLAEEIIKVSAEVWTCNVNNKCCREYVVQRLACVVI